MKGRSERGGEAGPGRSGRGEGCRRGGAARWLPWVALIGAAGAGCSGGGGGQPRAPTSVRAEPEEVEQTPGPAPCAGEAAAPREETLGGTGELRAEDVDCGALHCCALLNDKTVRCWGDNSEGELGDGTYEDRARPVVVAGLPRERPYPVEIAADYATCARMSDGTVWCWGRNRGGQLGDGTTQQRPTPARVYGLKNATQIAVGGGSDAICALLDDGTVSCWGDNSSGAVGVPWTPALLNRSNSLYLVPTPVVGLRNVIEIEVGGQHVCARLRDRTLRCWGENVWGQSGNGNIGDSAVTPTPVLGLKGVADLALRGDHVCALTEDQRVFCWGRNDWCQTGKVEKGEVVTPTLVRGLREVVEVAVSGAHSCARTCDGTVFCWGWLFSADFEQRVKQCTPNAVPGLPSVAQLAPGANSTCVRSTEGTVLCWTNSEWVLGEGTTENRSYAAPVQW